MLRALIVDDERLARSALQRLLSSESDVFVVGEAENIREALVKITDTRPNVVFMDIELRNSNGFEIFDAIEDTPIIVFVTAHTEYAVKAFSVNAADYLLKPVSKIRLSETLDRLRQKLLSPVTHEPTDAQTILLKVPGRSILVTTKDIAALKADGDFTHVLMTNQPKMMLCRTLAYFENSLQQPNFLRIGRSVIINLECICTIISNKNNSAEVTLSGEAGSIIIGPSAASRLRKHLDTNLDA
jgi:two-component system LytT family response regulator